MGWKARDVLLEEKWEKKNGVLYIWKPLMQLYRGQLIYTLFVVERIGDPYDKDSWSLKIISQYLRDMTWTQWQN